MTVSITSAPSVSPLKPSRMAGLVLTGFSSGLLGPYLRVPGVREPGSLRPTRNGTPPAEDPWMPAIGLGFPGAGAHWAGAGASRCPWRRSRG
ncbi:hypothetical protein [Streptomyces atratus]|uniref:Uncharacterized protein n=1 Tax=Streptomyces atratus TaxID=1893 RepID=A0A2Z5JQI5_STRAR|nr:hypothetical protein [Streptomyces atratus]AXE81655.1 hypothetical protein C5746_37245 [Streptomyces atratus]